MSVKIYTIGHSNKPLKELQNLLVKNEIDVLVDVRTKPYSKYNPQFNRENIQYELRNEQRRKIDYVFRGGNLGGLGQNVSWDIAIRQLIEWGATKKVCIMCSEADPLKCHRTITIQPDLEKAGAEVVHIIWEQGALTKKKVENLMEDVNFRLF